MAATKKKSAPPTKPDTAASPAPADVIETNPVEANEAYPTGSPPAPREEYRKIYGRYPPEEE